MNGGKPPKPTSIRHLGERLRKAETPSAADLAGLSDFRARHLPVLLSTFPALFESLRDVPHATSGRLKNTATIIEKMRRDGTRLPTMQDIAGLRIVLDESAGRAMQDRVVQGILGKRVLVDVSCDDRRAKPSTGYRAVHLVGKRDGLCVEIQVRTYIQHLWAQVNERLCDCWGRGVKYGEAPIIEMQKTAAGEISSKEVQSYMMEVSEAIAEAEQIDFEQELAGRCRTSGDQMCYVMDALEDLRDVLQRAPYDAAAAEKARAQMQPSSDGPALSLFIYDREQARVLGTHAGSNAELLSMWRDLDIQYRSQRNIEVVLLAATSGDTLVQTHARYVAGAPDLVGLRRRRKRRRARFAAWIRAAIHRLVRW